MATAKVAASEAAMNEQLNETLTSTSDAAIQQKANEAEKRIADAVQIVAQAHALIGASDADPNAAEQVRLSSRPLSE